MWAQLGGEHATNQGGAVGQLRPDREGR